MHDEQPNFLRQLFERNQRALLGYLTRKVGHDHAPDLLQETFLRFIQHSRCEVVEAALAPGAESRGLTAPRGRAESPKVNCTEPRGIDVRPFCVRLHSDLDRAHLERSF